MSNAIYLALSGMLGHERGLDVIGNNVTNLNTLGYRGSTVNFADVFLGTTPNGLGVGADPRGVGGGVDASRTTVDFQNGTPQNTGNDLDAFLQGDGFFIVQDETGQTRYTRAGDFDFVDNELVLKGTKTKVMTRDANGELVPITLKDLQSNPGKATGTITLTGNFNPPDPNNPDPTNPDPNAADFTIDSVDVFDKNGKKHTLTFKFTFQKSQTGNPPAVFDTWHLSVTEQDQEIGTADLEFIGAQPQNSDPIDLHLALTGADAIDIKIDDSTVQSQRIGTDSSVSVSKQDGFAVGQITGKTFDEKGVLKLSYSNGQSVDGPKLALAQFIDQNALVDVGNALFDYRGKQAVTIREAGDDLKVEARQLEGSNVDLTAQFSQLILMQRGYQACSQVLSTANDMLQELFDMRGHQ